MKLNKKAFSLIEVIIATAILSITVFWVYKLIWENSKILNNSDNFIKANTLFLSLEQCIKNLWITTPWTYSFNFWATWTECYTWTTNIVEIDNLEYSLSWILTVSWWNLEISNDEVWKIVKNNIKIN